MDRWRSRLIDDATKLLEATPLDDNDRKKAIDVIKTRDRRGEQGARHAWISLESFQGWSADSDRQHSGLITRIA